MDVENPPHPTVDNFQLFLRLMDDTKYEGQLFGDISGVTHFCTLSHPRDFVLTSFTARIEYVETLLDHTDLHRRLVYGSDYIRQYF